MLFNSLNTISKLPKRLGGAKQPNFLQVSSTITSTTYYSVGISDTGQYILALNGSGSAGFLYVSSNFGASFITISGQIPTNLCYPCAVSGTGQYMVMMISNGFMYRSENYGVNWAQVTNISTTQNWTSVALSKNGQYCLASGNTPTNNLYVSANFNTSTPTFTQVSVFTNMINPPYSNVISTDGDKMIQANQNDGIAISSNYGVSFTKIANATLGLSTFSYNCITMTPDTSNVYLAKSDGLFKSTNLWSGSPTFTQITSGIFTEQTWRSVVVSSDGTYVVASTTVKTYYSSNSGATWAVCYVGRLEMMSMSADAKYIVASNYFGASSKVILSSI